MPLEKEYKYFLENRDALFKAFPNKWVVIIDNKVVGDYDSQEEALKEAARKFTLGSFLIQKVSNDEGDVTQKFFSMVCFNE